MSSCKNEPGIESGNRKSSPKIVNSSNTSSGFHYFNSIANQGNRLVNMDQENEYRKKSNHCDPRKDFSHPPLNRPINEFSPPPMTRHFSEGRHVGSCFNHLKGNINKSMKNNFTKSNIVVKDRNYKSLYGINKLENDMNNVENNTDTSSAQPTAHHSGLLYSMDPERNSSHQSKEKDISTMPISSNQLKWRMKFLSKNSSEETNPVSGSSGYFSSSSSCNRIFDDGRHSGTDFDFLMDHEKRSVAHNYRKSYDVISDRNYKSLNCINEYEKEMKNIEKKKNSSSIQTSVHYSDYLYDSCNRLKENEISPPAIPLNQEKCSSSSLYTNFDSRIIRSGSSGYYSSSSSSDIYSELSHPHNIYSRNSVAKNEAHSELPYTHRQCKCSICNNPDQCSRRKSDIKVHTPNTKSLYSLTETQDIHKEAVYLINSGNIYESKLESLYSPVQNHYDRRYRPDLSYNSFNNYSLNISDLDSHNSIISDSESPHSSTQSQCTFYNNPLYDILPTSELHTEKHKEIELYGSLISSNSISNQQGLSLKESLRILKKYRIDGKTHQSINESESNSGSSDVECIEDKEVMSLMSYSNNDSKNLTNNDNNTNITCPKDVENERVPSNSYMWGKESDNFSLQIRNLESQSGSLDLLSNSSDLWNSSEDLGPSSVDSYSHNSSLGSTASILTSSNPVTNSSSFSSNPITNSSSFTSITTINSMPPAYPVVCMKTKMDGKMYLLHKEMRSLMHQDKQLFRQLITLNNSIETLKHPRSPPLRPSSPLHLTDDDDEETDSEDGDVVK